MQVVAPHLVLIGCIEVIKTDLSSGKSVVALTCKRCSRQHLDHEEYAHQRNTIHLYTGYSHKWDITP